MNNGAKYGIIGAAIAIAIGVAIAASMGGDGDVPVEPPVEPVVPVEPVEPEAPVEEPDMTGGEPGEVMTVDVGVLLPATGDLA
ncbi:MAG: hypothetical protein OXI27_07620, partial [Thaumarchaeota archaeon]|nr:hypothetical protein [Nitrososphaerota archaeon]MDE0526442.1 hypothetical protein [Nitrososphaerota archaeon]